jgi:hypothetical protein
MALWGTTTLNINHDNYARKAIPGDTVEIQLLPAASGAEPCTALQQKGRSRFRFVFEALVKTWAEYESYMDDNISKQARTFTDGDVSLDCIIFIMGAPNEKVAGQIIFSMTLMEA